MKARDLWWFTALFNMLSVVSAATNRNQGAFVGFSLAMIYALVIASGYAPKK